MTINKALAAYSRPNGWNDPDMLEVGVEKFENGTLRFTDIEARAHFSIWAIMSAPLIAGNDLVFMMQHEPQIRDILTNKDVIAINQDALGYQGVPVATSGELEVWAKPINESGGRAVVLLNKGETPAEITVEFADIGLAAGQATITDFWAHGSLGTFRDRFTALVEPHEGKTLKLKGAELPPPKGEQYLSDLAWTYAANGLGPIERDMTNGASAAGDGQPIALRGQEYEKGLGVGGPSVVVYRLGGACTRFSADVGISDETAGAGYRPIPGVRQTAKRFRQRRGHGRIRDGSGRPRRDRSPPAQARRHDDRRRKGLGSGRLGGRARRLRSVTSFAVRWELPIPALLLSDA